MSLLQLERALAALVTFNVFDIVVFTSPRHCMQGRRDVCAHVCPVCAQNTSPPRAQPSELTQLPTTVTIVSDVVEECEAAEKVVAKETEEATGAALHVVAQLNAVSPHPAP